MVSGEGTHTLFRPYKLAFCGPGHANLMVAEDFNRRLQVCVRACVFVGACVCTSMCVFVFARVSARVCMLVFAR